jgi:hypothetical protein
MAQPRPTRLREADQRAPQEAAVIDVPFKVVKGRRSRLASFGRWVLAFAAAGAIGFLIPPVWVAVQEIVAIARGG